MIEQKGNLWEIDADAICITTNGYITKAGRAVMGRGCALEAKERFPGIDVYLGEQLFTFGNHVISIGYAEELNTNFDLYSFPVKHHWKKPADLKLIIRSCNELMGIIEYKGYSKVLLPRPGCGNGRLNWEYVKRNIESRLDNRVVIVSYPDKE